MADYDYDLPHELIAQTPLKDRSASRLLVLSRETGSTRHARFAEIRSFLRSGDLLVLNDSRVIPARLGIRRESGGRGELLLLRRDADSGTWLALGKPARRLRPGERVHVLGHRDDVPASSAEILAIEATGLIKVRLAPLVEVRLGDYGVVPLPPYITTSLEDQERYQTVFSGPEGSAAAPTAGLHFTTTMIDAMATSGIEVATVTLHVGLDTFRPVTVDHAEDHRIHAEWYSVTQQTVDAIARCRQRGGRVIAVGTTTARTLEAWASKSPVTLLEPHSGDTDIFITPGYRWLLVDGLVTNFHLPKSTLMLMVSALAGRESIMRAYREAIAERYRFFSFGDAMLIV
jgi:S-adenosylmethionine:tRNA ribosyltransferase-isomerase